MSEKQITELPDQIDNTKLEEAFSAKLPLDREIGAEFFSHKYRKSTQLIGNNLGESIKGRREWIEYDLTEPVYITSIVIGASGYDDHHEMEINFTDSLTGKDCSLRSRYDGGRFVFHPKSFLRSFKLRPDLSWSLLKSQYINHVNVRGLEQQNFFEVVSIFENVSKEKSRIESHLSDYLDRARKSLEQVKLNDQKIAQQSSEIQESDVRIGSLEAQISELTSQRDEISKRIESGISNEKERNERVKAIELDIRNLNGSRLAIGDQISEGQAKLKELKEEINLFPTEISGYIGQGTKNINLYAYMGIIPSVIIALVTYRLFANAERLLVFDVSGGLADVIKFMISRSPYVLVSAAVLGVCYSLLKIIVEEVISINRKRQELFKISIIASDVSYASQHGLDLDPEETYDLRTQTKMELLKEHLKVNIGDEFTYSPKKEFLHKISLVENRSRHEDSDRVEN